MGLFGIGSYLKRSRIPPERNDVHQILQVKRHPGEAVASDRDFRGRHGGARGRHHHSSQKERQEGPQKASIGAE